MKEIRKKMYMYEFPFPQKWIYKMCEKNAFKISPFYYGVLSHTQTKKESGSSEAFPHGDRGETNYSPPRQYGQPLSVHRAAGPCAW